MRWGAAIGLPTGFWRWEVAHSYRAHALAGLGWDGRDHYPYRYQVISGTLNIELTKPRTMLTLP
jgi:hypothetical protein